MTHPPEPPEDRPATWIERPHDLERLAERLASCDEIALDTEANSMHAYREQTCIVQITADGQDAIIDALALEHLDPLRSVLQREGVEVVLHGGDYDVRVLSRDFGLRFDRVFDTMIAATLLGEERVGLAALVEQAYGEELNKRYQRSDWGRRPLSPEQMAYLQLDTLFLPGLRELYGERLAEADLVEESEIEFARLATLEGKPLQVNPEGWRRIKGVNRLDDVGRCVLHALWAWREGEAERKNRPPFKVFPPKTMFLLASKPPRRARNAKELPFLSDRERGRYGRAILGAVQRGLEAHAQGDIPAGRDKPVLSSEARRQLGRHKKTEDAIRAWRKKEAEAREVPNLVVLPNPGMLWIVHEEPRALEELARCPDIGPKRVARYGEALLKLVPEA